jgi:serine/threonine protein kinase
MTTASWEPYTPVLLDGYILLDELGEGGMGVVHLARAGNGSQVAVKVIRRQYLDDPAALRRFRREVEAPDGCHDTAPRRCSLRA